MKYTRDELSDFVNAVRGASLAIAEKNPSHYIVSLNGGLPLFDVLTLVDRNVESEQATYFPGSSRIKNSAEVLTRCFENFFLEKQDETSDVRPLVSLDEVVGGHSVARVINCYNSASRKIARANLKSSSSSSSSSSVEEESNEIREKFPLYVFGIKEIRENGTKLNGEYFNKLKSGQILEFPTKKIITMDDPDYETVKFKAPNSSGFSGQGYFPRVDELVTTHVYRDFLSDVARLIGIDPETVEPSRARVISDCEKYSRKPKYK